MLSAPFGPLQPLHEYILDTAQPLTLGNAYHLSYPFICLYLQGLLLQYPNTRQYRLPIALLTIYFSCSTWAGYRFYQPHFNAGNNLLGVAWLHFIGKAVEFGLLEDPVPDPFERSKAFAAYDLLCNSRWIGLRPVRGAGADERWLARSKARTRRQALLRHLRLMLIYGTTFDTLLHLLRYFGKDTVGRSDVPIGGVERFYSDPFIIFGYRAPSLLVDLVVKAAIGGGVFNMLILGYHAAAFVMVGSGLYEVEAWETDLFKGPLGSESLLDFWGKGWHQIFRHHFHLLTSVVVEAFHLPKSTALPIVFTLSGALHAIGQLSMSPSPDPTALFLFFVVNGLGCTAEIAWKRATGKKVQGWTGWMWRNFFLSITSGWAVREELRSGLGGTVFLPDLGPGRWVARLITLLVYRP